MSMYRFGRAGGFSKSRRATALVPSSTSVGSRVVKLRHTRRSSCDGKNGLTSTKESPRASWGSVVYRGSTKVRVCNDARSRSSYAASAAAVEAPGATPQALSAVGGDALLACSSDRYGTATQYCGSRVTTVSGCVPQCARSK